MPMTAPGPEAAAALVDLVVEATGWTAAVPDLADLAETMARAALTGAGIAPAGYEICVLACDDARIAELNVQHRGVSKPTNVLAWPSLPLAPPAPGRAPPPPPPGDPRRPLPLGDVALALQTLIVEAEAAAIPLKFHAAHLILHGCLHLLGYDHQSEADAGVMEGIESRVLAGLGYPDPYS